MAGSSQSTTTTRSQSTSDSYIPEYSESPFLLATANHARAMSDQVYAWGMDQFNKGQNDIDGLMRDALSYASPQRIAVDMGMAEAGVQQAGERGRQSAIRDLESYGIDPSSGRYAALDSANRVMTAAAAAGAGNQQRMADQAAGNAMRNQAIAAGLQNRNFGSQVGRDANAFLQTAMSLKYPPLGRTSQSTSATDSQSSSVQTDPSSGGSKSGGGGSQPKQQQPSGGGQPKGGGGQPKGESQPKQQAAPKPGKPEPTRDPKPTKPTTAPKTAAPQDPWGGKNPIAVPPGESTENPTPGIDPITGLPTDTWKDPYSDLTPPDETQNQPPSVFDDPNNPLVPPDEAGNQPPNWWEDPNNPLVPPDEAGNQPTGEPYPLTPPTTDEATTPDTYDWRQDEPADTPAAQTMAGGGVDEAGMAAYDPYANQPVAAEAFGIDPITGMPTDAYGDQEQVVAEADPAGALYGVDPSGGWTDETGEVIPASYTQEDQDAMWSDIGQGTMAEEAPVEGATWDSAYDEWTDPGYELPTYEDEQGFGDWTDAGYEEPAWEDPYAGTDWGDDTGADWGYEDQYADWGEEDYYDEADWGDDTGADWGEEDYGYEDEYADQDWSEYADEEWGGEEDYSAADQEDWTDYGDEEYWGEEDYTAEDQEGWTGEEDYAYEEEPYYEEEDYSYAEDDGGGDWEGGDWGARGGAVKRGPMRAGKRRARIMPPRGPRRMRRLRRRRPTGYAQGGPIPQQAGMRLDAPPRPPGAALRAPKPQQAPRPARGAPMAAPGGPTPTPMGRGGPRMPGNFISANGMPPPTTGGMQRPVQRMAGGGQAGRQPEPTQGGFVSRSLSPSGGSKTDDVNARLNAGEFVIPKDVATWKGKEFFYKMIAQARKNRAAPNGGTNEKVQTGFSNGASPPTGGMR